MQSYREEVVPYFKYVSYLVKEADNNGIDVMLTSDMKLRHNTRTSELVSQVIDHFPDGGSGTCNMELCLDKIRQDIMQGIRNKQSFWPRRPRVPASIYILTNGVWADDGQRALNAEVPIKSLVKELREEKFGRTHVVFQFIRFGNDAVGRGRLEYLDDEILPHNE